MWNIADVFYALIVCLNMIALIFLGKQVILTDYQRPKARLWKEKRRSVFGID